MYPDDPDPIIDIAILPGGLLLALPGDVPGTERLAVVSFRDLSAGLDDDTLVLAWPGGHGIYPTLPARPDKWARRTLDAAAAEAEEAAWEETLADAAARAAERHAAIMAAWQAWARRELGPGGAVPPEGERPPF